MQLTPNMIVLNIGLKTSIGFIGAGYASAAIETLGEIVQLHKTHVSHHFGGEPTLAVTIVPKFNNPFTLEYKLSQLALQLQQDCIAVYFPSTQEGRLIGPNAAKWGAFDPEFFVFPK